MMFCVLTHFRTSKPLDEKPISHNMNSYGSTKMFFISETLLKAKLVIKVNHKVENVPACSIQQNDFLKQAIHFH